MVCLFEYTHVVADVAATGTGVGTNGPLPQENFLVQSGYVLSFYHRRTRRGRYRGPRTKDLTTGPVVLPPNKVVRLIDRPGNLLYTTAAATTAHSIHLLLLQLSNVTKRCLR